MHCIIIIIFVIISLPVNDNYKSGGEHVKSKHNKHDTHKHAQSKLRVTRFYQVFYDL